ncbi:MAG: choice-of-anchor A family protein, partial [Solirubrobacteraceae bacterium]
MTQRPRDSCASLGEAAHFVAFSHDEFNASQSQGTSITGRIAAAGNVTVDGVSINPAAGDSTPTVIAGGDFTAGRSTGNGGTLNGGVQYGGSIDVAPDFTVNGGRVHAPPPFDFDYEFTTLTELSGSWGQIGQTAGATVTLNQYSKALELTGTGAGLNVFDVKAADLMAAAGVVINLTQTGATALINVTDATNLSVAPQYMNLSNAATAQRIVWNFPNATGLAVNHGVGWQGLILAPNAAITTASEPQLNGAMIAQTIVGDWVLTHVPFTGCVPPQHSSPTIRSNASASVRLSSFGALISDTAILTGGASPTGTILFELYEPGDTDCTGTPVFTSTSTVAGAGDYESGDFRARRAGRFRWRVAYSGDSNNDAAGPSACNEANESVVVHRARPTLSSSVSQRRAHAGEDVYDTANLARGISPAGEMRFSLYGPDDRECTGDPVFTSTVTVSGNGPHNSDPVALSRVGVYRWRVSYSGDANNERVDKTRCGAHDENIEIVRAQPAIATTASGAIALGATISDTATLSGGSNPRGTIAFNVYGPDDASCTGTPADSSNVTVSGNGDYRSADFRPRRHGTYRWVARYGGDDNNHATATGCGDPGEDVAVSEPPLADTRIDSTASP